MVSASPEEYHALRRLIGVIPASSCDQARRLLARFGSLAAVLDAEQRLLQTMVPHDVAERISAARAAHICALTSRLSTAPILADSRLLQDYLRTRMAHLGREEVRALYLGNGARLVADEVCCHGTVDESAIFPREVARRALELDATAIILAHNHPSGDPRPSSADLRVTHHIQRAIGPLNIRLIDHIIIGGRNFSMRDAGMLH